MFEEKQGLDLGGLSGWTGGGNWKSVSLASMQSRISSLLRPGPRRVRAITPATSMVRFVLLCSLWYTTSALSSNTGKVILNQFRYPVTLTFVQFGFVAGYCALLMSPAVQFSQLKAPTKAILHNTVPMGMFQVGGHIFSSMAISRIPVSTVHTIKVRLVYPIRILPKNVEPPPSSKALSPLFTVAAYAMLFGVSYSPKTYFSLLPLTIGVMLACSFDMSASNAIGLLCAFGSAMVFVTSNIFFKKIMPSGSSKSSTHKLDKVNLLFYSSSMAFVFMIPIWLYYDLPRFIASTQPLLSHTNASFQGVAWNFFMNGTVHFAQNIIAFVILSSTSPVTYSIASLIKRVAVICIAIVWFAQTIHPIQGFGIGLTFLGLYMYNQAKGDVEKGENKVRRIEAAKGLVLPRTQSELTLMDPTASPLPSPTRNIANPFGQSTGFGRPQAHYITPAPSTQPMYPPPPQQQQQQHAQPIIVPVVPFPEPIPEPPRAASQSMSFQPKYILQAQQAARAHGHTHSSSRSGIYPNPHLSIVPPSPARFNDVYISATPSTAAPGTSMREAYPSPMIDSYTSPVHESYPSPPDSPGPMTESLPVAAH